MKNYHTSIEPFLEEIRTFDSPNPEVLPQRSNFDLRDQYFQFRQINRVIYAKRRDEFVEKHLNLSPSSELSGLYFFFDNVTKKYPFFYIGKADNLFKRLTKHFLTFDYFFYSLAFPKNYSKYYSDCIRFYAEGRYEKNKILYQRQFEKFKLLPFNKIGWIAESGFKDVRLLKMVEDNSIFFLKPAANGTKGSAKGNLESKKTFEEIKQILKDNFSLTLPAG